MSSGDIQLSPRGRVETSRSSPHRYPSIEHSDDDLTFLIGWDGDDDPENPYNWPIWRIYTYAGLLGFMAFLIPLSSSIIAPAVPAIMSEFESTNEILESLVVSIFVLGLAFGPLIFAPLSEIYGRLIIYHACNVGFILSHVACALAPNLGSLVAFRFLAGFFGACSVVNGGASIADMVPQKTRGAFMGAFSVGPFLGPAIGPVAGGFLSHAAGWRWVFWLVTITAGAISFVFLLLAKETYAPVLLQRKVDRAKKETGNGHLHHILDKRISPRERMKLGMVRPFKLLFLSEIGAICALYMTVVYGYLYLMFTSITEVFTETYGFSTDIAGLAFVSVGIGSVIGLLIVSLVSDRLLAAHSEKNGNVAAPELRIKILPAGGILLPIGLFIYGWTAQYKVHWIVPMIGMGLTGIANIIIFMSIVLYLVDTFTIYAASALAANTFFRSLGGCFLPLAGLKLFASLGVGWGNSLLGFIAIAFLPMPFLFFRYGAYLRSRFDAQTL